MTYCLLLKCRILSFEYRMKYRIYILNFLINSKGVLLIKFRKNYFKLIYKLTRYGNPNDFFYP